MKYIGTCHCQAVRFEFNADLKEITVCDCSLCSKRAARMLAVEKEKLQIIAGRDALTEYRWNTRIARHYFCSKCGIYVFHQRRSNPLVCGVNANCVDGLDLSSLRVRHVDGQSTSTVPRS